MTIAAAHDYFDLLCDKIGSPYFTDDEKDSLISQACIEYVKRSLPSFENQGLNLESDAINYGNIYTLVHATGSTTMSAGGVITMAAIQTLLNTASSSTEAFMAILGVNWTKSSVTYPVRFTKNNNWFSYLQNSFKTATVTSPRYKFDKTNMTFSPVDTGATITFTLLKQPKATNLTAGTTIELPEHCHKAVVELAVELAATSIRDVDLKNLNQN